MTPLPRPDRRPAAYEAAPRTRWDLIAFTALTLTAIGLFG